MKIASPLQRTSTNFRIYAANHDRAWLLDDRWLVALFVGGLLLRLVWAALPLRVYLTLLEDDAWMVTAIARHWALGHGITADGVHPTNGFHPLYPLTLGVLPYLVAPNNLDWGFRANLVICAILNTLAIIPLTAILRHYLSPWAVRAGVALFALNPYLVRLSVNGMETSLALLMLLVLAAAFVALDRRTWRVALTLGVIGGLAVLARLDIALFVLSLGVVWAWEELRQHRLPLRAALFGLTTAVVLVPYFARNLVVFGGFAPSSGRALAYLHSYANSFVYTSGTQLIAYTSVLPLAGVRSTALLIALFVLAVAVLVRLTMQRTPAQPLLAAIMLYSLGLTFYYAYLQQQGNPRYYVGVSALLLLPLMLVLARLIERRRWRVPVIVGVGLIVGLNTLEPFNQYQTATTGPQWSQPQMYAMARWIDQKLPPDAQIAARNSGIFQYYSNHTVLNIDGKLNHEMIPVLERRELMPYLRRKGVQYVVDLQDVDTYIEFYSAEYTDAPAHHELTSTDKLAIYGRMVLYKLGAPVAAPHLDTFVPQRQLRRFEDDAPIIQTFPRPNEPDDPVALFRIAR